MGKSGQGRYHHVCRDYFAQYLLRPPVRLTTTSFSNRPSTPLSPSPYSAISKPRCNSQASSSLPLSAVPPLAVNRCAVSRALPTGGGIRVTPPPSSPKLKVEESSREKPCWALWSVSSSLASKPRRAYLYHVESRSRLTCKICFAL